MKADKPDNTFFDWQQYVASQQAYMAQFMDEFQQIMHHQQQVMEDFNPSSQRKSEWNGMPWIQENTHFWSNALQNSLNMSFQQFFGWHRQASNYANIFEVYAQKAARKNKPKE